MAKRPLFFIFLGLSVAIWLYNLFNTKNFTPFQPTNTCLKATIVTDPIHEKASYNRTKITFTARSLTSGLVNVISYDDRDVNLEYGDFVLIKGELSVPHSLNNPGSFNYREYLARKGIYSVITVRKGDFIEVLKKDRISPIRAIFRFRHKLAGFVDAQLPVLEASILKGVLLGDRSGIENDLKDKFVKTGTVHILAISGLHVGLIASIFILLLKVFYIPKRIIYPVAAFLLILYAALTGANVPVVRATIMAVAVLIGTAFNRKIDILNCLGLAGIIVLLKNPDSFFDAGFQLSFVTVISIIIFAPKFNGEGYLKKSIAVSFAAWLGIIPIIAYHFNIISPICILANIPVIFLLFLTVAAGLVFLGASLVLPFLSSIFAASAGFLISVLIKIVSGFSTVPFGFFWTHKWNPIEIIGYYIVLAVFGISLYKKIFRKSFAAIALLLFLNLFVWADILRFTNRDLRITMLDVGHGDAIVVEFPGGGSALIDTGKAVGDTDMGKDVVGPFLRTRRINTLEAVFITHYDDDHSGGLRSVLKDFKVRNVLDNKKLKRFDKITGFENVDILVLNPASKQFTADNDNSLVLKITYKGSSFLFCADIEAQAMEDLLSYAPYLKADFIKIPHHGAWVGQAERLFIDAVSPRVALISGASKDASAELLDKLYSINCRVYRTYFDGAVTVSACNLSKNSIYYSGNDRPLQVRLDSHL